MAKVTSNTTTTSSRKMRPALTPEAEEGQMISLAMDLVKRRLIEGTASSQETTHFLKLATRTEQLKREQLEEENRLLRAKTTALQSSEEIKQLYTDALKAMRNYSGQGDPSEYEH